MQLLENLQTKLLAYLNGAEDFLIDQIPPFVEEILMYYGAYHWILFAAGILSGFVGYKCIKKIISNIKGYNSLESWWEYDNKVKRITTDWDCKIDTAERKGEDVKDLHLYKEKDISRVNKPIVERPDGDEFSIGTKIAFNSLIAIPALIYSFILPAQHFVDALKITLAPRLWLVEYAAEIVKTTSGS